LTEIEEKTAKSETGAAEEGAHVHDHDGHDHDHEGHDHEHGDLEPGLHTHSHNHGPALNPECTKEISVEAPAAEVAAAFKATIKRYQKLAKIPGFRAGKVPETVIRNRFMKDIRQEVLETLVSEKFRTAIDESGLQPVSQPQVVDLQLHDGESLKFKASFEVVPEFDVAGYD
jgi:trigger factor